MKRVRSGSVSGRLRSASQLFEDGAISQTEKSRLKEMIIAEDPKAADLINRYDKGDKGVLRELASGGHNHSIDLVDELSLDLLNFGGDGLKLPGSLSGSNPNDEMMKELFNMDDNDAWEGPGSYGANSLGSVKPLSVSLKDMQRRSGASGSQGGSGVQFGTPPNDLFDFDFFGETAVNGSGSQSGSYSGFNAFGAGGTMEIGMEKDDLVELEELTDSFTRSEDMYRHRNKDRSASTMSLGSVFRDGRRTGHGYGSESASSNPMAIPNKPRTSQNVNIPPSRNNNVNRSRQGGNVVTQIQNSNARGLPPSGRQNYATQKQQQYQQRKTQANQVRSSQPKSNISSNVSIDSQHRLNNQSTHQSDLMASGNENTQVGAYSPNSRRMRIEKFLQKRQHRIWKKRVKYDVRKNFADSRLRVKGRFVKKEDEELLRDFLLMTV